MAEKTWAQLEAAIGETFRKWGLTEPTLGWRLNKRSAARRNQTKEERGVSIDFVAWAEGRWRKVRLTMVREDRAIDNLAKLAQAVEWVRMAEVREITPLVVLIYRQLYPTEPAAAPPPRADDLPRGPYAVLHVANDAPLEVCEAAYKALTKKHHPDLGGDTATMQRLNGAIELIRNRGT